MKRILIILLTVVLTACAVPKKCCSQDIDLQEIIKKELAQGGK